METINKLLKKQAPKVNRKAAAAAANGEAGEDDASRPSPVFIRWVNGKNGSRLAVPREVVNGPIGTVFQGNGTGVRSGKMVEEVA
jgi:Ino eighty subunit 2